MKINPKILCIPPYISTSWKNVLSLHLESRDGDTVLIIGLVNGSTIEIPHLEKQALEAVFTAHEKYLEQDPITSKTPVGEGSTPFPPGNFMGDSAAIMNIPLNLGFDIGMGNMLQHSPEASDSPDLPSEVLERVASLSKAIDFGGNENMPKPEPHCNCMHCQIVRAIRGQNEDQEHLESEEEVTDEDLRFREWDITQADKELFIVTNPLSPDEHYNVFLGTPVGCTCGQKNCEHIRAVLNS